MRKLLQILAAGALALAAAPAAAAPVQTGATLSIRMGWLGSFTVTGTGTVSVTGSTVYVPAGLASQAVPLVVPVTASTAIQSISAYGLANRSGTFSLGGITSQLPGEVCASAAPGEACNRGGSVGGAMGITGSWTAYVLPGIVAIPIPFPLGEGGTVTTPFFFDNAGFTAGQGFVRTDNATRGSQQTTFTGASGPLKLVSPTYLSSLGNVLPVTATFTLHDVFLDVPEPGAVLLLAAGLAGLVAGRGRG